jgi:hypothetical protein
MLNQWDNLQTTLTATQLRNATHHFRPLCIKSHSCANGSLVVFVGDPSLSLPSADGFSLRGWAPKFQTKRNQYLLNAVSESLRCKKCSYIWHTSNDLSTLDSTAWSVALCSACSDFCVHFVLPLQHSQSATRQSVLICCHSPASLFRASVVTNASLIRKQFSKPQSFVNLLGPVTRTAVPWKSKYTSGEAVRLQ